MDAGTLQIHHDETIISINWLYTSWSCGGPTWGEVIIWILLWESGSVNSLILFEHRYGPLYYVQGSKRSNGIFDQRRKHRGSNTVAVISGRWTSQPSFFFFFFPLIFNDPDFRGKEIKTNVIDYTARMDFLFVFPGMICFICMKMGDNL